MTQAQREMMVNDLDKAMITLTRIEFSSERSDYVVEAARKAREALENLCKEL